MATIKQFEDLVCWQRARELANFVFDITDSPSFRDIDLKRQIRRAAISPMSNIAEGFDRGTRNEFVDALYIAKGEVGEVRAQLYVSLDRRYISSEVLEEGLRLTDECARLIQSFADKVKGGAHRGVQFKVPEKKDALEELVRTQYPEYYDQLYRH